MEAAAVGQRNTNIKLSFKRLENISRMSGEEIIVLQLMKSLFLMTFWMQGQGVGWEGEHSPKKCNRNEEKKLD